MSTLNARNFGLAIGITWAFGVLLLSLFSSYFDWGSAWVPLLGDVYLGYEATLQGAVVGAIWGFFDGFFGGYIIAWIYNKLQS